ncbi:MAG: hypothetical protein GC138_04615 [Gammaproteobacteria bacterium]|nr:hypothetical protein [Gammaproteobacteria bacterium]
MLNNRRMILSVALFIASMNVMANIFGKPEASLGPAGIELGIADAQNAKHKTREGNKDDGRHNGGPLLDDVAGAITEVDADGCSSGLLCGPLLPGDFFSHARPYLPHTHSRYEPLASTSDDSPRRSLASFTPHKYDMNDLGPGHTRGKEDTPTLFLPSYDPNPGGIVNPGLGGNELPNGPVFLPPGLGVTDPSIGVGGAGGPAPVPLPNAFYPMTLMLGMMLWYAYRCRARGSENTISSL